jgi:hypothetical protein
LLERDSFDLLLPEFDKPWVIHLRETCCYSTNLCTWRPNTIYKDRSVRRHQASLDAELKSTSKALKDANATKTSAEKAAKVAEARSSKDEKALSEVAKKQATREGAVVE